MIQRGDKVLCLSLDMPGEIVDQMDGDYQIAWEKGHDSPLSGGTFWGGAALLAAGLVEVVGENGHEPSPVPVDLFEQAFRLAFELTEPHTERTGNVQRANQDPGRSLHD